jgi:hydroxymethylbilane synthase
MNFSPSHPLRIGTRKSALAKVQTETVCQALRLSCPALAVDGAIEIIRIDTLGDQTQARNLSLVEHGGKALWATEHEAALRGDLIDCAVHSVKDMPGLMPEDMTMPCILPRETAWDVFLSPIADHFMDLPEGAVVGTSSPRRAAITLSKRPDLKIETFRGNIESRLKKLADGVVDATYLAAAGLERAGLSDRIQTVLEPEDMLPAVGQGAIGIEFLDSRDDLKSIFDEIHCETSGLRVAAERGWLKVMDGSCRSPIAAYAHFMDKNNLKLCVFASTLDGSDTRTETHTAEIQTLAEAEEFGQSIARRMKAELPDGFFGEI